MISCLFEYLLGLGGGYFHKKLGLGYATHLPRPFPYLCPKSVIFPTLVKTWPKIWYLFKTWPLNQYPIFQSAQNSWKTHPVGPPNIAHIREYPPHPTSRDLTYKEKVGKDLIWEHSTQLPLFFVLF